MAQIRRKPFVLEPAEDGPNRKLSGVLPAHFATRIAPHICTMYTARKILLLMGGAQFMTYAPKRPC
jgi:hypothetical protein